MRLAPAVVVLAALLLPCSTTATAGHAATLELVKARACGAVGLPPKGKPIAITPDGDGRRDCVAFVFRLSRAARVELVVAQGKPRPGVVHIQRLGAKPGVTSVLWRPSPTIQPRTYVTRLAVRDRLGTPTWVAGPVIRVRGTHARFERGIYAPGQSASLNRRGRALPSA